MPDLDFIHNKKVVALTEESDLVEILEAVFLDIERTGAVGCFQRLICDISASPQSFEKNVAIVDSLLLSENVDLSPKATNVRDNLYEAFLQGESESTDGGSIERCELVFNQCQWSGQEMDEAIKRLSSK